MKLSFDEGHRQAICQLGGIHVIANLVETEHSIHGSTTEDTKCILMRRYACMALTNLTFGDSGNKALLCSFKDFMRALVIHLQSPSDELRQVTASVLRNLSWRADPVSKEILREVGTVTGLMKAAMMDSKENTLKSILSALWNLSAHCTENKAEICAIKDALGFLVDMLTYKTPSKSLAVIENSGGILRNISSQIAVREDYREILRQHNCLQVLLEQLKSPSLTIVSNACGTLWNLSAKNAQDQETLWQMGAPSMLRSLNHSKHKMIAMGSSAALKNLLSSRPSHALLPQMDATAKAMDLPILPTLGARKQKALLQDLDQNLHETFDNIESPTRTTGEEKFDKYVPTQEFIQRSRKKHVLRSESQECVSQSELVYESTRTSKSDSSAKNESLRNEEKLSRREEHLLQKESWKDELKIDVTKTRLPHHDDYLDHQKDPATQLCQPFASLNINEASTSSTPPYQKDYTSKLSPRLLQSYGNSSLPYNKRSSAYISVRTNYSDCAFEDEIDSGDQPIDFSRKYDELKSDTAGDISKEVKNRNERSNTYGIYAETDLDQPTDYSLRYAEDDSDSDLCDKKGEFIQDTVKTYYTEGTPYETPFNFSTATSMSDLRMETNEKVVIDNDDQKRTLEKTKIEDKNPPSDLDEKDHCSVEDISENESRQKSNDKALKSQFSSGLMSPEKPVHYCEEGTPGYFSRVSSFGSLNSIPANENLKLAKQGVAKKSGTAECEPEIEHRKTVETSPHES
ncbi:Armadillo repeat containing protein, partial [Oryctes borbonicus]